MNIFQFTGFSAGLIGIVAYVPYVRDILLHKTQPERATWLIWALLGSIVLLSQIAKGATNSLWLPAFELLGQIIVLALSFSFGYGPLLKKKDIIAVGIASLGLLLWYFTKEAAYALYIVMAVDFTGSILTIQKAYIDPESETLSTWTLSVFAGFLSLISVGSFNIILLSYPIFITVINGAIATAMILGRKINVRKTKQQK